MTTLADDTNVGAASPAPAANVNAAAAPRASPGDELKTKKEKLKAAQDQIAELNKNAISLQQEVQLLEAKIAEVTQAGIVFNTAADSLNKRYEKIKTTVIQKIRVAQAVIKEDQERIDDAVSNFDAALAAQEKEVKDAEDEAASAAKSLRAAQAAASSTQQSYEALKTWTQELNATLASAEELLAQAAKAEARDDYVALYFFASEARQAIEELTIPVPSDYLADLAKAQEAAAVDKASVVSSGANSDAAARKAVDLASKLAGARASRRTDLLAKLREAPVVNPGGVPGSGL